MDRTNECQKPDLTSINLILWDSTKSTVLFSLKLLEYVKHSNIKVDVTLYSKRIQSSDNEQFTSILSLKNTIICSSFPLDPSYPNAFISSDEGAFKSCLSCLGIGTHMEDHESISSKITDLCSTLNITGASTTENVDQCLMEISKEFPMFTKSLTSAKFRNLQLLNKDGSKKMYGASFSIEAPNFFEWSPGDSIGLVVPNNSWDVNFLLSKTKFNLGQNEFTKVSDILQSQDMPYSVLGDVSYQEYITHLSDIHCIPAKELLLVISDDCEENEFCSKECAVKEKDILINYSAKEGVTLLDILWRFKSLRPSAESLLRKLPRIKPRAYSLTNTDKEVNSANEQKLDVIFNLVEFPAVKDFDTFPRLTGTCTGWLVDQWMNEEDTSDKMVKVYMRKNLAQFHMPSTSNLVPLILIGPGTGIAPFLAMMKLKELEVNHNKELCRGHDLYLYHGCRDPINNFPFAETIGQYISSCVIQEAKICFSRAIVKDQEDISNLPLSQNVKTLCDFPLGCKYVQDCLKKNRQEIIHLIMHENASVMVCGDGSAMCKAVREVLQDALFDNLSEANLKDMSAENDPPKIKAKVKQYFNTMRKNKRYLEDVWS